MTQKAQNCQPNSVKRETKGRTEITPTWRLAIADAEAQIARLHRSIELFKQYEQKGMPFPEESTQN